MAGHRPWKKLRDRMSPERRRRIDQRVREQLQEMLLAEIRKLVGMTQAELAEALDISQAGLSQMEHQDDIQISTLRRIVEALGGELEIIAHLPNGRISISPFSQRNDAA